MLNVLQIIGSGDIGEGIFPTVSDWVVTDGFYEEVTFESSPEWRKEATYTDIWGKSIPGGRE